LMMLSTLPVVPLAAVITTFFNLAPELIVPIISIALFVGGLFRIFYALIMEDDTPQVDEGASSYSAPAPQQFERSAPMSALPPASANPTAPWRARPNTSEIYQPPSITENTTRLLDKDDPKNR